MSAIDIQAERDKIQREIDALERSLGPNVATIDVTVSDSSDDSDDDDLDAEDQFDRDGQTDELAWDDGDNTSEICLQMNLVYQAVIQEKLQEVELLITQNKEQQEELLWELAGRKTERAGTAKPYPLNLSLGCFTKPYFKDKVSRLGPPANQEMMERSAYIVKTFKEFMIRKWRPSYSSELRNAIISDTLQKMLQPKLLKLEYLQQKRDNAKSDIDRKILTKQIQETEHEIDDIKQLPETSLLGQSSDEHDWEKISNINFDGLHNADRLRAIWRNYEHPHINKEPWEDEEILKLQEIAKKNNFVNWQEIADELGTKRTPFQCLQTFQLNNKDFKRKEFTKEEDEILTHLVQRMRDGDHIPYQKISYFMEGRDGLQLLSRWTKSLDPNLIKGAWSKEEDEMLLKAVAKRGAKDWYKIRNEVPGRNDAQCRERYCKGLHKDLKKGRWSQEEHDKLLELTVKYGVGHWAAMARELRNRSGSQCLSKWKNITGYFKRRIQRRRKPQVRPKKIKKDVLSDEEPSISSSDSSSSSESIITSSSSSSSSESEDIPMELTDDSEEEIERTATPSYLETIPDLDLWVPRSKFPDPHNKSLIIHSASSDSAQVARTKTQKKGTGDTFQFNTILKGIAYLPSTDTVTETPEDFLVEAADSGCQILQIAEDDVRKVLKRNSRLCHDKQIQRLRQKQPQGPAESGTENTTTEKKVSRFAVSQFYKASMDRKLLFAVTPWVGNIFLPLSTNYGMPRKKRTRADVMRNKLRSVTITSTPIFTLLIKFFQIDAEGCLQMIRLRKLRESEFLRTLKSCTMQTVQGRAQSKPLSRRNIIAQSSKPRQPKAKGPQADPSGNAKCGVSVPKKPQPQVKAPGTTGKAKTVFELLKEKRLQQSRAQKAARNTIVLSSNILIPPQIVIHQQRNPMGQPQPMVLPMASPNPQNGIWPVMPFVSLPTCQVMPKNNIAANPMSPARGNSICRLVADARKALAVPQTTQFRESCTSKSTSDSPSMPASQALVSQPAPLQLFHTAITPTVNRSPVPMTWFLTPQGLISLPAQAVRFANPTQPTINQSAGVVFTPSKASVVETSTHEAPSAKTSEATADVTKSPTPILPAVQSSLPQEGTSVTSTDVHPGEPAGPPLPSFVPVPGPPNQSAQFNLTPKKYPVVKIAKLLPASCLKTGTVDVSKSGKQGSTLSKATQSPTAGTEKNTVDMSLISMEKEASVKEWLQGNKVEVMPQGTRDMAYLPPSICTLKTFSRLLLQKKALETCAFRLVPHVEGEEEVSSGRKQKILSDMVEQRLKDNPAYLLLKQRFISAFTFPGFLAVFPPTKSRSDSPGGKIEDSDEDSDESIDSEMTEDGHGRNIPNNSMHGHSEGDAPGATVPVHSEQEKAGAQCDESPADNTNSDDIIERRVTRNSANSRRRT